MVDTIQGDVAAYKWHELSATKALNEYCRYYDKNATDECIVVCERTCKAMLVQLLAAAENLQEAISLREKVRSRYLETKSGDHGHDFQIRYLREELEYVQRRAKVPLGAFGPIVLERHVLPKTLMDAVGEEYMGYYKLHGYTCIMVSGRHVAIPDKAVEMRKDGVMFCRNHLIEQLGVKDGSFVYKWCAVNGNKVHTTVPGKLELRGKYRRNLSGSLVREKEVRVAIPEMQSMQSMYGVYGVSITCPPFTPYVVVNFSDLRWSESRRKVYNNQFAPSMPARHADQSHCLKRKRDYEEQTRDARRRVVSAW